MTDELRLMRTVLRAAWRQTPFNTVQYHKLTALIDCAAAAHSVEELRAMTRMLDAVHDDSSATIERMLRVVAPRADWESVP